MGSFFKKGENVFYTVEVNPKGLVRIPLIVRKQFGLKPKTQVSIEVKGDDIILHPVTEARILKYKGIFGGKGDILKDLKKHREEETKHEERKFAKYRL